MLSRKLIGITMLLLAIAGGCKRQQKVSTNDDAAIRDAIQRHLNESGVNVAAINQDVKKVSINGDQALADVDFRLKKSDQNIGMSVEYVLQRTNGRWDVVRTQPVGGHSPAPAQSSPENK